VATPASAQVAPPAKADGGVSATPFDISAIKLNSGRWQQNQNRVMAYLKFVDPNRMLYVFNVNHKLSTNGAAANGGWDDPTFPFRSHFQGHLLSAWAQCYAQLKDTTCSSLASQVVAGMLKAQQNNAAAGFATGYLSGFPESDFTALENGTLTNGNVPYYVIHKTMAGLLDVWRNIGDNNAKTALLALAGWVNTRTAKLSTSQMQSVLNTEHGGMVEVLTDTYFQTGDSTWLTVAKRFEHTAVLTPLANNQDQLNGLHGNTQVPKWIGAAREYKASGNSTDLNIAKNAWNIVVNAHAYAMGGITEAEHFHAPNAISTFLQNDTAEFCDTYNMLKLTRELFAVSPTDSTYFDFYERALMNHLIGAQNPSDSHGAVTYFSSLNPGVTRGLGPAWGGGTYSTDYASFWCCMGTNLETNTKLQDSIYFSDSSSLYVNLFTPSTLTWSAKSVTVTQSTNFPITDSSTITVTGGGTWAMKIRIPSWTSGASITVNGASAGVSVTPGSYASVSRTWASGDTVVVTLPMNFRLVKANDNGAIAAIAYGPAVLVGMSSSTSNPTLTLSTLKRTSDSALTFTGTANGATVNFVAWFEGQGFPYVTYWVTSGSLPAPVTTSAPSSPTTTVKTTTTVPATTSSSSGATQSQYGQCGGTGYTGPTTCASPFKCTYSNDFYSQCL
jgi:DUF1680 family protein